MERLNPGVHLAGSYPGSRPSVPSCSARGRKVAETILEQRVPASDREKQERG